MNHPTHDLVCLSLSPLIFTDNNDVDGSNLGDTDADDDADDDADNDGPLKDSSESEDNDEEFRDDDPYLTEQLHPGSSFSDI